MCCPHWRSIFSSVFKEPKLVGTRPFQSLVPSGSSVPAVRGELLRYRGTPSASTSCGNFSDDKLPLAFSDQEKTAAQQV
ncbi:MAG: hypothetical protein RI958_1238 [Actinomycetota bacterium]|jgi:hypothetical protein